MRIRLLRLRWGIWDHCFDRSPDILVPALDWICPTDDELYELDVIDGNALPPKVDVQAS